MSTATMSSEVMNQMSEDERFVYYLKGVRANLDQAIDSAERSDRVAANATGVAHPLFHAITFGARLLHEVADGDMLQAAERNTKWNLKHGLTS